MPRTILSRGLPGDGLETVIEEFARAASEDPFGTWLILPTKHLVRTVTRKLVDGNHPVIASQICTLQDFCITYFEDNRTTTRFISKAESSILLQQILFGYKDRLPLFFTRSRPSSGTLESLQEFINVIRRRKISYPECLGELQGEKSRQIGLVLNSYQEKLRSQDLVDSDTILDWTISHISSTGKVRFGEAFIYGLYDPLPLEQDLLSVIQLNSREFTVCIPNGIDKSIFARKVDWAGIPARIDPVEPSSSIGYGLTGMFSESGLIETNGMFRYASFPTPYQELNHIAGEICRLHDEGVAFSDIAVTLPELREKVALIGEVFADFAIPWNVTTGTRIFRFPVIQFILGILRIVTGQYSRDDVVQLVSTPYFPYVKGGGKAGELSGFSGSEVDIVSRYAQIERGKDQWLHRLDGLAERVSESERKGDKPPVSPETVARVKQGISHLFRILSVFEGRKPLREHSRNFSNLLDSWGLTDIPSHPDPAIRAEEQAALKKFEVCLKNVDQLSGMLPDLAVTCGEFQRYLSAFTEELEILPAAEKAGVSVIGIRECVHEKFRFLFFGGLIEGEMPRLTTRLPFTNMRENVRMGTRSLEEILQEQRYYFIAVLLAGQEAVYLSAPLSDGENPLLTSAFLERAKKMLAPVPWGESTDAVRKYSRRAEAVRAGEMISSGEICMALPHLSATAGIDELTDRINIERYYRWGPADSVFDGILSEDEYIRAALAQRYSPAHVYSPTVLETYAECPFRFMLEKVAGLRALPEVEPNLSARDRGTVVHNILSNFYRAWRSQGMTKVLPSELSDATDLMIRIVSEELDRYSFRSPVWAATCIQMTGDERTGPGIFERFLKKEAEEADSPLVPTFFEMTFGMRSDENDDPASVAEPVEIQAGEGMEPVRVKGRIDRIDLTPDGVFTICDYKTGTRLVTRNEIESGKALQIPFYLLAFETISGKRGLAGGYYRIRRDVENKIVLLDETGKDLICSSRPRVTKNFRELLRASQEAALRYIAGIRSGAFPLPPEEKCPNLYCEFRTVCRFDPSRVFAKTEEA